MNRVSNKNFVGSTLARLAAATLAISTAACSQSSQLSSNTGSSANGTSPLPAATPTPTPTSCTISPNDAVVTTVGPTLCDSAHNVWAITSSGTMTMNGATVQYSANVIELAYVSGVLWQENSSQLWWSYVGGAWTPAAGTSTSPLPAATPSPTPTPLPSSTLTVTSPANGATVSGTITINGVAGSQWVNVAAYDTSNGNAKIGTDVAPSSNRTYSIAVNTAGLANGTTGISVTAFSVPAGQSGGTSASVTLSLNVRNSPTPTPSPTNVISSGAIKGINPTGGSWYLMNNLDSTQLSAMISDFRNLGVQWVRWEMDADVIDPNCNGKMNWGTNDAILSGLHAAGINVMALLNQAPGCMNSNGPVTQGPTTSTGISSWASFAQAVAQRYGASGTTCANCIQAYEIWNEPNCGQFWTPSANPGGYVSLDKAAYSAIHGVDNNAIVLAGSSAPCGDSGSTIDMQTWFVDLYAHGLHGYADGISAHPYCASPVGPAGCDNIQKVYDQGSFPNNNLVYIMSQNGDSGKKVWFTEWGEDVGTGSGMVTQAQQAADVASLYQLGAANSSTWAGPIFWYNYQDFNSNGSCSGSTQYLCEGLEFFSSTGVGAPKSSYSAFQSAP